MSKILWTLKFSLKAEKKFDKLDPVVRKRIFAFLDERVVHQINPRIYGKQLTGIHADKWSYRIGDYRLLAHIKDEEMLILAINVGHRRDIYD